MIAGFRAILVKFSIFALVAALLGYLLVNTMLHGLSGDTVHYKAAFADVSGLRSNSSSTIAPASQCGCRLTSLAAARLLSSSAEVLTSTVASTVSLTSSCNVA